MYVSSAMLTDNASRAHTRVSIFQSNRYLLFLYFYFYLKIFIGKKRSPCSTKLHAMQMHTDDLMLDEMLGWWVP